MKNELHVIVLPYYISHQPPTSPWPTPLILPSQKLVQRNVQSVSRSFTVFFPVRIAMCLSVLVAFYSTQQTIAIWEHQDVQLVKHNSHLLSLMRPFRRI